MKGDISFVTVVGSVGTATVNFETKVPDGNFRHQLGGGKSFKCGLPQITGKCKLEEDEYEGKVFYRLLGVVSQAAQVQLIEALANVEW